MNVQPSGTVTLVFTDIEGSTRLLERLGQDSYLNELVEHRRIIREAFAVRDGYEVDYEGDSFFYAFPSATTAVEAVRTAMAGLTNHPIKIRVGIHTGEPGLDPPKYVGRDVHLAARIMSAGHGGQVLLSAATRALLHDDARDLGEHRLKDFDSPVQLFQLGDGSFPPLKTISNTNLPHPASSFVGREREVDEVLALLRESRLVTLTGPGGSGKTRLAIETAAELISNFKSGVFWIGLATLRDPALVLPTIAGVLGAPGDVAEYVGDREILLLLDNLEQVVDTGPALVDLVETCPRLTVMSTSRERLRVRGEVEYQVLPLAEQDALELFCTRAAVDRSEQARELCRRLDNMPLALELAAARATVLTVEQILDRLSQRLDLFKGGRGADPRQETLRATIEWSYSLLGADDQQLFAALSIFPGGCTLEAVEEVCDADLDTLQSLVDKSLLRRTDDRFWMLETIADFAGQQLTRQSARTAGLLRRRQADWQLDWAANVDHRRKTQTEAFRLLLDELPNIRAARASLAADDRVCDELRLATLLASGLFQVGLVDESKEWLELALARSNPCPSSVRAEALMALSMQTSLAGDPDLGARYAGDADTAARDADDLRLRIDIAMAAGVARLGLGELEEAELLMAEALVGADEIGDVHRACELRNNLSYVALLTGDLEAARSLAEAGLDEARRHGDNAIAAALLHNLFLISMKSRREELALEYLREGLDFSSRHALMTIRALFLEGVAWVAARRDVPELAASLLGSSAKLAPDVGEAERDLRRDAERRARESLGDHEFEASSEAGKRLTIEEATELAENWLGEAACAPTQPTGLV